jgi:hypothetical protein
MGRQAARDRQPTTAERHQPLLWAITNSLTKSGTLGIADNPVRIVLRKSCV